MPFCPRLLTAADARDLIKLYDRDEAFRSTVTMERHQFGAGEYRYLAAPLPEPVDELRHALIPTPAAGGPRVVHQARTTHALA